MAQAEEFCAKAPAQNLGIDDTEIINEKEPKARWEKVIKIQEFNDVSGTHGEDGVA